MNSNDPAIRRLAQHILTVGFEEGAEIHVSDHVEQSPYELDWSITQIDTDDEYVEVTAEAETTVAERTSRATRHHPAEYTNHDVLIVAVARVEYHDGLQLAPDDMSCTVEQVEGPWLEDPYPNEPF